MNKPIKNLFAFSIVAVGLAGAMASALAEENAMPMSNQQMMMKGQPQAGGMTATKPCYGSSMMNGNGYGMQRWMGGGYGPGMMGGFGPGAGMMMGQGMMGGGMGSGMMGQGYGMGPMAMLDLSDAQMEQMVKIQAEAMKKQRKLMRQMWNEQENMSDLYDAEERDPAAIGKAYGKLSDLQRQAIEMRIETENKVAAVLTKEQKTQMRRGFGRGMMGYWTSGEQ